MERSCRAVLTAVAIAIVPAEAHGQEDRLVRAYTGEECPSCAEWNLPRGPAHLFGNTFHVGTRGLGSVLIAAPEGHVLIDGGLPDSAPMILANVGALGFDPSDVKLILNSHAHFDHAGGIAALRRATGARVSLSRSGAGVLQAGRPGPDDPQYDVALAMPRVADVEIVEDGQTVRVGSLELTAHVTGGHTPGSTTWSWRSCEGERCVDFVYADSQTPVSSDDFRFSDSSTYPTAVADFERSFALLETMPCDVLITPHPEASSLWQRLAAGRDALIDAEGCKRYAARAREQLRRRLERERQQR